MKRKIILLITFMFLFLPVLKVRASSMDSYIDWNLDMSVFAHQYRNGSDHITNLAMLTANGKIAYCIEPGILADKGGTYNSTFDINDTKLKNVDIKKLSLIGYYGYGYKAHENKEYYMATQELIWRLMGVENVWWTDSKEGGNVLNIDWYKNEIMRLVDAYEIAPSFNFGRHMVGEEVEVSDLNNVLNEYEVYQGNAKIEENKIKIKLENENNTFTLRRKTNGKNPIFYYKDGFQTIGSFEYAYDFSKTYDVKGVFAKITVNKLDYDTKTKTPSSKYASLEGAEYKIYTKQGELLSTKYTDSNGNITFDNLPKGTYVIRETKASLGYTVWTFSVETFVSINYLDEKVDFYEKIIKNNITIQKVLDDEKEGIMSPEKDIEFGLYYEDGELFGTYTTDENGFIKIELPYGKYILKQHTKIEGIDVAEDKVIEVINNKEDQNITIINHKIPSEPEEILPEEPPVEEEILPEEPQTQEETIIEEKEEPEIIEELPNTGKMGMNYLMVNALLILLLYYFYERKTF